jgi:very-short-patch-repair endonuclease
LWRADATDGDLILKAIATAEALDRWPIARAARRRIAEAEDPGVTAAELRAALESARDSAVEGAKAMAGLADYLQLALPAWCEAPDIGKASFASFAARSERAAAQSDLLPRQCTLVALEQSARASGLGEIVDAWIEEDLAFAGLASVIDAVWLRSAAEAIVRGDPTLSSHAGHAHEGIRRSFQKLDLEWLELNRQELRANLARRDVPAGSRSGPRRDWRERELLAHQCSLDRPSMHLRRLFALAGEAIRALKPCIMMSPMSVARYLQPSRNKFDIVIIDEGSQMRPEDAAGAMLRGHQAVIVGDPKQLPPTSFFQAQSGADEFDEDANEVVEDSILELAMRAWKPVRTLKWHYRSRHQSLIAYSNARFYDSRLIVFPSDRDRGPTAGVHLEDVKGVYAGGRNEMEAKAIVEAAARFMANHPTKSLGIVAMNQKQQELISNLMDELYASDPIAESYRRHWSGELEHVFVKNLENVQGDERDAIFISAVYGPDEKGAFMMRFGPINLANGHRRLNVLFTRAKEMMTVFTSMDPAMIKVGAGSHEGPKVLKEYLDYARTGFVPVSPEEDEERAPESEFERWFIERLRHRGYEAVPQVGVRGYRIDIGVRHPDLPGRFILGVECDGATYHSAKAARDRDRLRQMVLERLGWQIHRIWSTDWFRDAEAEFDALLRRIEILRGADRRVA